MSPTRLGSDADPYSKLQTQMNGLGTIVAMPQWYVNFNLANLLKNGKTTTGKSLQDVELTIGEGTWLKGKINKMWTEVFVSGSTQKVKFILSFTSGSMDYYDISQIPPVKLQADIKDLQFGFDVDLNRADVQDNQSLPDDVKKRVSELLSNLRQGAFTVKQLFMDFENATLSQYDPSATLFPGDFSPSAKAAFPLYLTTYLQGLSSAGGNILGYAIEVNNPGGKLDPIPTFPPTDLQFATNRYIPSQNPEPSDWKPDLDTINYQMMTDKKPFPVNLPVWFGNFVVPDDDTSGWYGTIVMAHQLFVQSFLLPQLAPLVTQYWKLKNRDGSLDIDYDPDKGGLSNDGLGGLWNSGQQESQSHKTNSFSNDDVNYNFEFDVKVNIIAGKNQIIIKRNTNFDIEVIHWYGVKHHAASDRFRVWYVVPLTITITLLGVQDGKLTVSTKSETTEQDPSQVYSIPYGWLVVKTEGNLSIWNSVSETMESVADRSVEAAIPEALLPGIEKTIQDNLNLKPFVFPGGAELFMINPTFNNDGDLMLGLAYKV